MQFDSKNRFTAHKMLGHRNRAVTKTGHSMIKYAAASQRKTRVHVRIGRIVKHGRLEIPLYHKRSYTKYLQ